MIISFHSPLIAVNSLVELNKDFFGVLLINSFQITIALFRNPNDNSILAEMLGRGGAHVLLGR